MKKPAALLGGNTSFLKGKIISLEEKIFFTTETTVFVIIIIILLLGF